jgi:hypothetical protein
MLDAFHETFVPEAVKHEGYIRVKMLKRRSVLHGRAPAAYNYRFELEFESEALRQKWIASTGRCGRSSRGRCRRRRTPSCRQTSSYIGVSSRATR